MRKYRQLPVTLGEMIRSIRMGYRIFNGRYFLRMSREKTLIRIDLAPFSGVEPKRKTWDNTHLCWWESDDEGWGMVQSIPDLRNVVAVHRPISFLVNQDGAYCGS